MVFSTVRHNGFLAKVSSLLLLLVFTNLNAQEIRVIDNKGSFKTIQNNRVFTKNDDPSLGLPNPTPPTNAIEGDIWLDDSGTYRVPKIWSDGKWKKLIKNNELNTMPIARINADTTLTEDNHTIIVTGSTQITVTLPDPTTCEGRMYRIKNTSDTHTVLISGGITYDDDGSTESSFPTQETTVIESNGTGWIEVRYTY